MGAQAKKLRKRKVTRPERLDQHIKGQRCWAQNLPPHATAWVKSVDATGGRGDW
jgi:hypothetical protein